jgi:hypothetical protein
MDLTTSGVVIKDALKYFQSKMEYLNAVEKQMLQHIKEEKGEMQEEKDINRLV